MTNFERIKAMSIQEVASVLLAWEDLRLPNYCQNKPECNADLDADRLIPEERCKECVIRWLEKEDTTDA